MSLMFTPTFTFVRTIHFVFIIAAVTLLLLSGGIK